MVGETFRAVMGTGAESRVLGLWFIFFQKRVDIIGVLLWGTSVSIIYEEFMERERERELC